MTVSQFLDRNLSSAIEQLLDGKSFAILQCLSQVLQYRVRCFPSDQSALAQEDEAVSAATERTEGSGMLTFFSVGFVGVGSVGVGSVGVGSVGVGSVLSGDLGGVAVVGMAAFSAA